MDITVKEEPPSVLVFENSVLFARSTNFKEPTSCNPIHTWRQQPHNSVCECKSGKDDTEAEAVHRHGR